MKLSTVLLSSAALLVAGAAYAADLPAKKAAPAAAPTGCAAFGAGYISIPGGDTCLKISGYVRSNTQYTANTARGLAPYSLAGAYGLEFESASSSEVGTVASDILIENAATSHATVSFAGLTAGYGDSPFDYGLGGKYSGQQYGPNIAQMTYSQAMGSSTLTVTATTAANSNSTTTMAASRPDLGAVLSTTAGAFSTKLGVVSHEVAASATSTAQGYAFMGKASFDAGVATISGYAAYANGAATYLGSSEATTALPDSDTTGGTLSTGTNYAGQIKAGVGKGTLGIYGGSYSISQNGTVWSGNQYAAWYTYPVAKNLNVTPEVAATTLNGVITNVAYLRIQRDF